MTTPEPDLRLSLVVPTFKESGNVHELLRRLGAVLENLAWEAVFVDDDSPDGTATLIREIARRDRRVRCVQRVGRRGLSSACIEGMLSSSAPVIAVLDADLQHDETILTKMLHLIENGSTDLVVATRYAVGGGIGTWGTKRAWLSRAATAASRMVLKHNVSDPMSGFFMLKREVFESALRQLSGIGFKILLDILSSSPPSLRIREVPYTFRERFAGSTKLDEMVVWEYGMLLADKLVGRFVPVRFLSFAIVGGIGVFFHFSVLSILLLVAGQEFTLSQAVATAAAMVFNFSLNNILTYRDRRLRGFKWLRGLFSFMVACSVGGLANVGIASFLYKEHIQWFLSAFAGVLVGAVWNYAITQLYTWGKKPR
jgi:dolichol-phosphate mannosyltransferase